MYMLDEKVQMDRGNAILGYGGVSIIGTASVLKTVHPQGCVGSSPTLSAKKKFKKYNI